MVTKAIGEVALFGTPHDDQLQWGSNELHGELLASRFSNLVLKGYRPIVHCEMGSFDFEHPHKKAIQIQLRPDGQLVDRYPTAINDGNRTLIAPDDSEGFDRFLAEVPRPTELQLIAAKPLGELLTIALAWVLLYAVGAIAWAIAKTTWHFVTRD